MNNCLTGNETGLVQYTKFDDGSGYLVNSKTGSEGISYNAGNSWIAGSGVCMPEDKYCYAIVINSNCYHPESKYRNRYTNSMRQLHVDRWDKLYSQQ